MSRSLSDDFDLLCKFGSERLHAIVCQAVNDGRISMVGACLFLRMPSHDIIYCADEIQDVVYAIENAIDNGLTVDAVAKAESKERD